MLELSPRSGQDRIEQYITPNGISLQYRIKITMTKEKRRKQ